MKKSKLFVLPVIMFLSVFAFTACDDDDDNKGMDPKFNEALLQKYPDAVKIEWERKGDYQVADCHVGANDLEVWYTAANAEWKMTETELPTTALPAAISEAIKAGEYAAWRIDDVDMLEYPAKDKEYVVEVEQGKQEFDLYYSESGEFLRKKDVSGADDTHWPE